MQELIINLHMHTPYSDGHGSHAEIVQAAMQAGLDVIIVTDHNVFVSGPEDYYKNGDRRVLLLVGEEIHDQARQPQKNHLLVFGADRELSQLAHDPQRLLDGVRQAGGLSFLAHPVDPAARVMNQPDISWVDWQVQGFTGIEIWNSMSEFKSLLKNWLRAFYFAYNPSQMAHAPFPEALRRWDELLSEGRKVVAIGGSDAHAIPIRLGPLHKTLFPYEFHFRCINTHVFIPSALTGDVKTDRRLILEALAGGRAFIGYDLPASTRGFRFSAQGKDSTAWMGEEISSRNGVTLQIRLPLPTECRLVRDGKVIKSWQNRETCTHITTEPGAYRVEAYIEYKGRRRGWIFSNPIYVKL
jgi:PHP domain